MAEPLKNVYTPKFIALICSSWKSILPNLDGEAFAYQFFKAGRKELELKGRMNRLADAIESILPNDFTKTANLIKELISKLSEDGFSLEGFEYMFILEYIEKNGLADFEISLNALKHITK